MKKGYEHAGHLSCVSPDLHSALLPCPVLRKVDQCGHFNRLLCPLVGQQGGGGGDSFHAHSHLSLSSLPAVWLRVG